MPFVTFLRYIIAGSLSPIVCLTCKYNTLALTCVIRMQEAVVKHLDRVEYLGHVGLWGTLIAVLQVHFVVDSDHIFARKTHLARTFI